MLALKRGESVSEVVAAAVAEAHKLECVKVKKNKYPRKK